MTHYQSLTLQFSSSVDSLPFPSSPSSLTPTITNSCSFPGLSSKLPKPGVCWAAGPGSPVPKSGPPPEKHLSSTSDFGETFSRAQDRMQIFFAVLFWMSLFFWNCAWNDGSNDDGPNKKSRFRR